jgi:hypothetical protein
MKLSAKVGINIFKEETVVVSLGPPQTPHKYCEWARSSAVWTRQVVASVATTKWSLQRLYVAFLNFCTDYWIFWTNKYGKHTRVGWCIFKLYELSKSKMLSQDISVLLNCECCVMNHDSVVIARIIIRYPLYLLDATIHSTPYFW